MKIFEKRPLALILCIMLGGFSFFADFSWEFKLIVSVSIFLLIGLIFVFETLKFGRKPIILISLVALILSLLLSIAWEISFYPNEYYNQNVEIDAKIYDIDNSGTSTAKITCKTSKINGKRDRHTVILYLNKDEVSRLKEYDIISFRADIEALAGHDDGFDGKSYYVSQGYSAIASNVSEITISDNKTDKISALLDSLRLKISNKLKLRTDFNTGSFLSALIIGDRSDLSGNTKLNFSRLGISHILALSGMHLAILTVALNFLLIKISVKKKIRVFVLALIVLFYMGLTGFSPSVLRSGAMLIISGILYLLATKSDPITTLIIAVFGIVAINPTSVYDTSLWLSAFATLGVILFSELATKPDENATIITKILIAFRNASLVSVFAFCATFAFVAPRFESFSVVSIFTTIFFSFVIQFFIYGGILLIILGGIIPFGKLVVLFSDTILWIAEAVSSLKFVSVSMNSLVVKILIVLLSIFFFSFVVLDIKNKKKGVLIIVCMLLSVFIAAEIHTVSVRYNDDVVYAPNASGDLVLLKSGGDVTVIYSGKSYSDDAWDVLDYFNAESLTYIDNLVFASYSYSTVDFVQALANGIKIERIMFPSPTTDDEIGQAEGLSYLLEDYGARLEFYDVLEYLEFGEYKYRLFEKVDYYYGESPSNVYEIVLGNQRFTYVSVCKYEDLSASSRALIWNTDNLLIGTVGNSNYYIFDMRIADIERIYYSDDGRLTDDAEAYYKEKGASVYCTKSPVSLVD